MTTAPGTGAQHDVVVIGGGPAGAAATLLLARHGRSVALVHLPAGRRPRLGETVPPGMVTHLARLGVWDQFVAAGHTPAPGSVAVWGSATPYDNDFLFDPYGYGWHLDRARFDGMLLGAAEDAGADVHTGAVSRFHHDDTDGWTVQLTGHPTTTLRAPWLIDASGRAAHVARRQGVQRNRYDRLIGLARFYAAADTVDTRTLIEATETGWWYFAALPEGRAVAVLFTDADLLPGPALRTQGWDDLLAKTALIRERLSSGSGASCLTVAPACSSSLASSCGRAWLAIGDAAQSWDPLSGQGITKALSSAVAAVEVLDSRRSTESSMDHYADRLRADFRDYMRERSTQYGREARWAESPFWRRRAAGAHAG